MVTTFRELRVYQAARHLAADVYRLSKAWPKEERYALTDQIRRSSRSVCANVAEAWRKRRYPRHFVSKLTDADAESAETQAWLDMALDCGLVDADTHADLDGRYDRVLGSLVRMMRAPDRWCGPATLHEPPAAYDHKDEPFGSDLEDAYAPDGFEDDAVDPDLDAFADLEDDETDDDTPRGDLEDDTPPLYVTDAGPPLPSQTPIPPHPRSPQ